MPSRAKRTPEKKRAAKKKNAPRPAAKRAVAKRPAAPILGLRTVIYPASDLARAKEWWTTVLGFGPYFDEPFYVGFNVGGFELGLDPDVKDAPSGDHGGLAYWGVRSIDTEWTRVLGLGAAAVSAPKEVGGGIKVAILRDPFGNRVGLIENPHFKA